MSEAVASSSLGVMLGSTRSAALLPVLLPGLHTEQGIDKNEVKVRRHLALDVWGGV